MVPNRLQIKKGGGREKWRNKGQKTLTIVLVRSKEDDVDRNEEKGMILNY